MEATCGDAKRERRAWVVMDDDGGEEEWEP